MSVSFFKGFDPLIFYACRSTPCCRSVLFKECTVHVVGQESFKVGYKYVVCDMRTV